MPGSFDNAKNIKDSKSYEDNTHSVVVIYNVVNPDASPAGTTVMTFTICYTEDVWGDFTQREYVHRKQELFQKVMDNFEKDDFYYYVATEKEKEQRSKGISLNDLFGAGNKKDLDKPVPLALKLTDEIEKKLGLDEEYDYYIAFAYSFSASGDANYRKYVEYLFGKC